MTAVAASGMIPAGITGTETVTVETEETETVTAETEETETVTAETEETVTVTVGMTETVTAGVTATVTGMIPDLSQDLTQDRSAAEIIAAVMRKGKLRYTFFCTKGNVCLTFPFLFWKVDE